MEDGKLELMKTQINIVPTSILCNTQKVLVKELGFKKAYELLYTESKSGSFEYNKEFIKKENFSDKRKILDWQIKIVTFAGWGELEAALVMIDSASKRNIVHFKNSTYPLSYGPSDYAVDFISAGFIAGGLSAMMDMNLDVVETKCIARKDPFCEFEVGKPKVIESLRTDLWKKWKVV